MEKKILGDLELDRVYQRDVLDGLKLIPDNSVDLIIADPPYFEVVKNKWDRQWDSEEDFFEWCQKWISECKRVLKAAGSIYIWNWFDNICTIGHIAKQEGLVIRNLITWNRGGGRERNNWCSAKEDLLYLTKTSNHTFNLEDVLLSLDDPNRKMKKSSWERCSYPRKNRKNFSDNRVNPSNVWFDSLVMPNSKEKVPHPTQKPLSVCARIIKASSNENDIVLIPFCGSGSECVAAKALNRNFISFEVESEYIELANTRLGGAVQL